MTVEIDSAKNLRHRLLREAPWIWNGTLQIASPAYFGHEARLVSLAWQLILHIKRGFPVAVKSEGRIEVQMVRGSHIVYLGLPWSMYSSRCGREDKVDETTVENGVRETFRVQFMKLKALPLTKCVDAMLNHYS